MYLFDMTESQLDQAVQAHYDQMYRDYYHLDEHEQCCANCTHYSGGCCAYRIDLLDDGEVESEGEEADRKWYTMDEDDYCPKHEFVEPDYPDYMDGD